MPDCAILRKFAERIVERILVIQQLMNSFPFSFVDVESLFVEFDFVKVFCWNSFVSRNWLIEIHMIIVESPHC